MNVLSLFDGGSCGQVALERQGIPVNNYYASEVDTHAIKITQHNYPDTIQLGDINDWKTWDIDWSSIDLLTAGFPCQAWSVAGKQKGDNDPRGALVHVLISVWGHCENHNPKLKFLFENVRMKKEFLDFINDLFGVEPIRINSNLVSAQNRDRYYWTNIEGVTQPEDKGILLKDIVHEISDEILIYQRGRGFNKGGLKTSGKTPTVGSSSWEQNNLVVKPSTLKQFNIHPSGKGMNGVVRPISYPKSGALTTNKGEGQKILVDHLNEYIVPFDQTLKIIEKEVQRGKVGYFKKDSQANRVYFIHDKAVTLLGTAGGGVAKMGQYLFGCITPDRVNKRQNGQRFNDGKKFYTLTAQDKHGVLIEGYIRKLTPVECERLQTLPDNYTLVLDESGKQIVSNTQRYKVIGNGWTVDTISHIYSFLNTKQTRSQPMLENLLKDLTKALNANTEALENYGFNPSANDDKPEESKKVEKKPEKAKTTKKKEKPVKEETESEDESFNIEDVRAAAVMVSKKKGRPAAMELLADYDATKVGDIKEKDYPKFIKAANDFV